MAPRIPKQNTRFINPQAESSRGRSALEALRGYAGAPSQASVMYPGSQQGYEAGELAGMAEMLIPGAAMAKGALGAALAGVIKPRGGNWIPGDVESSISNLLRPTPSPAYDMYGNEVPNPLANSPMYRDNAVLNRWIEGPLTKYIKRDMATPEDPVRKLADQGILHMGIPQTIEAPSRGIQAARKLAGFPERGLSTTLGGSLWENLSDRVVEASPARYLQDDPKVIAENPWMQKLDPESVVYSTPSHIERGLGLDHLVDELSNSLNPGSGLPRNLLLRPEQMQQMGMEKAVRHVDAINKWRAANRAKENAELANKAMIVREYAENNPKGLRWVELKQREPELDEGWQVKPFPAIDGFEIVDEMGRQRAIGATEKEALERLDRDSRRAELERQLKYEGDTMGHCVGGYCPDVIEGRSRIFSLRDAKGEPHVTVEVEPSTKSLSGELLNDIEPGIWDTIVKENGHSDLRGWLKTNRPDVLEKLQAPSIVQIKGKQNLAPKDEYLPFVQDFVRNSPLGVNWGQVGDLSNTNLIDISGFPKRVEALGSRYVTEKELTDYLDRFGDDNGMADGGLVAQPDYFDDLDAFLRR